MLSVGLTNGATATTLSAEIQGDRAGRKISVNNGILTDSFDGSAVHIYKIGTYIIKTRQIVCTKLHLYCQNRGDKNRS